MSAGAGHSCTHSQLMNALAVAGCDRIGEQFVVRGGIFSFMGMGEEFVIAADAEYRVGGEGEEGGSWHSIAGLLGVTSYGNAVTVIA